MYIYVNILDILIENICGLFLKLCVIVIFYSVIIILKCYLFKIYVDICV